MTTTRSIETPVSVPVSPALLKWARVRSGIDDATWANRFPLFDDWVEGNPNPTLDELQNFAEKTYTPIGYFFLSEPPQETVPIPDFRAKSDGSLGLNVSVHLLDTLYACQARQEWYRCEQLLNGEQSLKFFRTATTEKSPADTAAEMSDALRWGQDVHHQLNNIDTVITNLRDNAEDIGVLVMIGDHVGSDTHRQLDTEEFRGFALADPYASIVFVNGADSKAAQVFTLVYELAHLWLGATALSDFDPASVKLFNEERWCYQVAEQFLVPMEEFEEEYDQHRDFRQQLQPLARKFCVPTQVILGRLQAVGAITWDEYMVELDIDSQRSTKTYLERKSCGDDHLAVGNRFAKTLMVSTLEGRTTYTEAFRLLDIKKTSTFETLSKRFGLQ